MAANVNKQEALFELIHGMSKAEKRNFKLYAARNAANQEAKFIALFDVLDSLEEYDEAKVLRKTGIKKEQLPNMKAYLYRQLLVSIRLLNVQHVEVMEIHQMVDFARILYDKSMIRQALQMLDRAKTLALDFQNFTLALEIVEFEKRVASLHMNRNASDRAERLSAQAESLSRRIANINDLSNLSVQLYSLNLQLGYVRSEKDRKLVTDFFKSKLEGYDDRGMSFHERLYLYQARMWYSYIRYDFVMCYRHALRWLGLFDEKPELISAYYDHYVRAVARLLDVLFMTRRHDQMLEVIAKFERELPNIKPKTDSLMVLSNLCLLQAKINVHFLEGSFAEGISLVSQVDEFLVRYGRSVDEHYRMLLSYKIACLYFGHGDYKKCISYLHTIISIPNPQFRRDLQVFARILHLIASYEAGDDYSLEAQIKNVYSFVLKVNDMHSVQHKIITFLKRIPHTYASDFKGELKRLYDHLKPFETHPYERRPFFYLDIISWLESKIQNIPIADIIRAKYQSVRKG